MEIENDKDYEYLIKNKFIVKLEEEDELLERDKQINEIRQKIIKNSTREIGYIRISLTEKCNLRCKYCFVDDIVEEKRHISNDLFSESIEFIINNTKRPRVQYFGGEPLIRMDLIRRGHQMLCTAKASGIIENFAEDIVTNGTLLNEEQMDYFIENDMTLIFSIDGWKNIHDKNRIDKMGNGSFCRVIENLKKFKGKKGKAEAIITINDDNIEILDKVVQYLVETHLFTDISINSPQPNEKGWDIDGFKLAQKIIRIFEYCESKRVNLSAPGLNLVKNLVNKEYQIFSCVNFGSSENLVWGLYLFSSGLLSYCNVETTMKSCEHFDKFIHDDENKGIDEWHFIYNQFDECRKCIAFSVCGGPCSMERSLIDNLNILKNKCNFNKTVVKWALTR